MKKDILFYSNFCTYSKEIVNNISKTSLNDSFLFVSVDDENIQLPPFITSVPTIYLINDKKIVVDEAIPKWINEKLSSTKGPLKNDEGNEIHAYFGTSENSLGLNYASIDDTEYKPFVSDFTFISDDNGSSMAAKNDSRQSGMSSEQSQSLEQLETMRNQEFQPINRR